MNSDDYPGEEQWPLVERRRGHRLPDEHDPLFDKLRECRSTMCDMQAQIAEIKSKVDEIVRILPDLQVMVENRRALSRGQKVLIAIGAGLTGMFVLTDGAQRIFEFLHRISAK